MSRKAERMAGEYVSAVLSTAGIAKAAGGGQVAPGLLLAAVTPLCEHIVAQDKAARRSARVLKANQRVLDAICGSAPVAAPSPMRLPARPRQVDFRPQDWRTALVPASEPLRNGAHHAAEATADYTRETPEGHAG